jgi:Tetracyclin repressor-like, C-terminal domain
LSRILDRARARGEIAKTPKLDIVVDQAFGLLWYRMIFAHHPLDERAAADVAAALAAQLGANQEV